LILESNYFPLVVLFHFLHPFALFCSS